MGQIQDAESRFHDPDRKKKSTTSRRNLISYESKRTATLVSRRCTGTSLDLVFPSFPFSGVFHRLVRLELDSSEEAAMVEFARESCSREGENREKTLEALLAYYLHRSRFAEAHQLVKDKRNGTFIFPVCLAV